MTFSLMIMIIIYGLFIKDIDFNLDVKNPESAPSPIDSPDEGQTSHLDEPGTNDLPPAKVQNPDNPDNTATASSPNTEQVPPLKEMVPLEPQYDPHQQASSDNEAPTPAADNDDTSLHYVYLDGFSSRTAAEMALEQLQGRSLPVQPYIRLHNGQVVLQFGVYSDQQNADDLARQLRQQSLFVKVD